MMKRVEARATGRVQGVGFRYHVTSCAGALGIAGTVRNLPDGTVEIIAEGEVRLLSDFLEMCHARGDLFIRVERIDAVWKDATGTFHSFSIIS